MNNWVPDLLNCGNCNNNLSKSSADHQYVCDSCGEELTIDSDGLVLLEKKESDYYWGEVPLDEMNKVIEISTANHWTVGVKEVIEKKFPDLKRMILADDRIEWINFFDKEDLDILDVGGGWGQTGYLLAKNRSYRVTSLEKINARSRFQAIRARQDSLDNLNIIHGDLFDTNFRKEIFDLVTFIGVLEWVGVSEILNSPRDVQILALKKVHESLKEGGAVCIGIENRIGFNNFLGAKDHSGLRFTSLMPRALADIYLRLRKPSYRSNVSRSAYRTFTYSAAGYKKLLKDAGFKTAKIYISHPHYAHAKGLIEYNNADVKKFFSALYRPVSLKDTVFKIMFKLTSMIGVGHVFAPHYIVVGYK